MDFTWPDCAARWYRANAAAGSCAAAAIAQHVGIVVHAPVQAAISGQPEPVGGHGLVARHAPAILVAAAHHVDGHEVIACAARLNQPSAASGSRAMP